MGAKVSEVELESIESAEIDQVRNSSAGINIRPISDNAKELIDD